MTIGELIYELRNLSQRWRDEYKLQKWDREACDMAFGKDLAADDLDNLLAKCEIPNAVTKKVIEEVTDSREVNLEDLKKEWDEDE